MRKKNHSYYRYFQNNPVYLLKITMKDITQKLKLKKKILNQKLMNEQKKAFKLCFHEPS